MLASAVAAGMMTPLQVMAEAMQILLTEAKTAEGTNMSMMMQAVSVAEKMAPYMHPRLSQVAVQPDEKKTIVPDFVVSVTAPKEQEIRLSGHPANRTTEPSIPIQ